MAGKNENIDDWEDVPVPRARAPRTGRGSGGGSNTRETDDWQDAREPASEFESAAYGSLSGAAMDFDDEIIGAVRSAMGPKKYEEARDEWRQRKRQAKEDNPNSYLAGEIGGGVASGLVLPGGAIVKGASTLSKAARAAAAGAAYGGIAGAGASESEDIGGVARDAAQGAGVGAIGGAAISGAGKVASKALGAAGKVGGIGEKFYKVVGEIPDDIAKKIKDNPGIVERARTPKQSVQLSDEIAERVNQLTDELDMKSKAAWKPLVELDKAGARIPGSNLATYAQNSVLKTFNLTGSPQSAQTTAKAMLQNAAAETADVTSYQGLKRVIQNIDANINWDSQYDQLTNEVLQAYRTALDRALKRGSPAYKKAMEPLASTVGAIDALRVKYGLKKGSGLKDIQRGVDAAGKPIMEQEIVQRLHPTDRTIASMETSISQGLGNKGQKTRDVLKDFAPDVHGDVEAAAMDRFLQRDLGRGSRSTIVGSALGWLFDIPIVGAALGYLRDKEGRRFAAAGLASLADKSSYVQTAAQNLGGPVADIVQKAMKRGGNSAVMVAAKALAEKSPEFRQELERNFEPADQGNDSK